MKRPHLGLIGAVLAVAAFASALVPAGAQTTGQINVKWSTQAIVSMSFTPNYNTGFGQVKAVFGTQPAPTHGPNAGPGVGQGDIDFGNVLSGTNYIYKYAAHVNVTTNDPSGFKLYGEGAANFYNATDATSQALSSTLFYANSVASGDSNTGYTPGFPFQNTSGIVSPSQPNPSATPSINYNGSYPSYPVATNMSPTGDFYYDYLLKVPQTATSGQYFVWVVYTVVPQ